MDLRTRSLRRTRQRRRQTAVLRQLRQLRQQNQTIADLLRDRLIEQPDRASIISRSWPQDPTTGVVYFLLCEGLDAVKVGKTKNLKARIAQLQTGCAERLRLLGWVPGYTRQEKALHQYFSRYRLVGEWFHFVGDLRRYVEAQGSQHQYVSPSDFFGRKPVAEAMPVILPQAIARLSAAEVVIDRYMQSEQPTQKSEVLPALPSGARNV